MDKIVICSSKENGPRTPVLNIMDDSHKHSLWKKPGPKEFILYGSIYVIGGGRVKIVQVSSPEFLPFQK